MSKWKGDMMQRGVIYKNKFKVRSQQNIKIHDITISLETSSLIHSNADNQKHENTTPLREINTTYSIYNQHQKT